MFSRIELKNNAKKILRKNYWWAVLVTLILGIVTGTGTGLSLNSSDLTSGVSSYSNNDITINNNIIDEFGNITSGIGESSTYSNEYVRLYAELQKFLNNIPSSVIFTISIVFIIVFILAICLSVFVLNPLQVGCRKWYLLNRKEKAEIGNVAYIFSHGYLNTVKVMFFKSLFTALWSLLLVIPGIVKSYEYRMIPYLLAENPNMDMKEAFERSRNLMNGNKWDAFVLDISFLGWEILASLTLGILNLFYVAPYMEITNAELYVCLCQGREKYNGENSVNSSAYDNPIV
jgi:hypothetical protein